MSLCPRCGNKVDKTCKECKIVLNNYCSFCDYETLKPRIFYEDGDNWIGFLAAPFNTLGHSIILPVDKKAKIFTKDSCNFGIKSNQEFEGLDDAFFVVSRSLIDFFKGENVQKGKLTNLLYASLCGDENHFHFHIIPRWSNDEERWRKSTQIFEKGYLFDFLSFLEKEAVENARIERLVNGWCETKQRFEIIKRFDKEKTIETLSAIANSIRKNRFGNSPHA